MRDSIISKLNEIEKQHNITILLAVESGSRAWGFASPDSDYDVRFIYVRPETEYLRLEKIRDVVELPIDDILDINGWDLDKTLRLLYRSNPTVFEWLASPIIYRETPFAEELRGVAGRYFSPKRGLYHYLSMAERNYNDYLKDDLVKAKKYFYALRPVLACRWILDKETPPPMLFTELAEAELDPSLKGDIDRLLDIKMNTPEVKLIPRAETVNRYLTDSMEDIRNRILQLPEEEYHTWEELNSIFFSQLK